ncbi:MAG TPA: hypothetical protein VN902_02850 [Candidatus Acidoferrales bacterium]|nr:hypothetical protein [Candidatus Acidoferrales bacterium]
MSSITSVIEETQHAAERLGLRRHLGILRKMIGEPLVHFLLIGLALFALYAWMERGNTSNGGYQITLTLDDLRQLDISFVSQ